MLIRFMVQNYRSFKEQQTFSMVAGKQTRHKNHIYEANGKRLLKGSVIYGANAGGKSNLIKAIQFARNIALGGINPNKLINQHYRIEKEYYNKPGVFQFDFYANNKFYSYGFAVSYVNQAIESEWLYEIKGENEICIFDRNVGEQMVTDLKFNKENETRFRIYSDDVQDKNTFLAEIINKKIDKEEDFSPFFEVGMWFTSLIFIFPQTRVKDTEVYNSTESQTNLAKLLNYFDTGIEGINGKNVKADEALSFLPDDIKNDILKDVSESLNKEDRKQNSVNISIDGKRFRFNLSDNGEIVTKRLIMNHGNTSDYFDYDDESDGTKRLFDLIPIYSNARYNAIIFVDELDRSFHTKLTVEFIKKFFETTASMPSQLIATLHDSNVMDLEILRQDEIWFVDRNNHSSEIFTLNKFKQRFDKDVAKDYIQGRYGAIPCFSSDWSSNDE